MRFLTDYSMYSAYGSSDRPGLRSCGAFGCHFGSTQWGSSGDGGGAPVHGVKVMKEFRVHHTISLDEGRSLQPVGRGHVSLRGQRRRSSELAPHDQPQAPVAVKELGPNSEASRPDACKAPGRDCGEAGRFRGPC